MTSTPANRADNTTPLQQQHSMSQGSTSGTLPTNNPHIAALLEAEREAANIINRARQYRVERIKSAKDEAKAEIEAHRRKKQAEYEENERGVS